MSEGGGRRKARMEVIVLDDDESPGQQPVVKRTKLEGEPFLPPPPPPPSDELVDLQQKLQKKEDMFQRACRAAREAEVRAERAEHLLDSKQGIRQNSNQELDSELEKRLDELSIQLAEARRRESESTRENDTLKLEMIRLRRRFEAANRVASVPPSTNYVTPKAELSETTSSREHDLTREISALKMEVDTLRSREEQTIRLKNDVVRENAALKAELEVAAGRVAESKDNELARENAELKEVIKSLSGFRDQFEEMKRRAEADRARDKEVMDTMAAKVKAYEKQRYEAMKQLLPPLRAKQQHHAAVQQLHQLQHPNDASHLQQLPADAVQLPAAGLQLQPLQLQPAAVVQPLQQQPAAKPPQQPPALPYNHWLPPARQFVQQVEKADPINILEPYRPFAKDSFTMASAIAHIQAKKNLASDCGKRTYHMYYPDTVGDNLECLVCRRRFTKAFVIHHFLSAKHIDRIRQCKAAVSLPAVMFWLGQLQAAADAAAAAEVACAAANPIVAPPGAQPPGSAASAATEGLVAGK